MYDLGDVVEARKISNATAATTTAFDEQDSLFALVRRCSKDAAACEQMELAAMNFSGAGEWREVLSKLTERLVEYNLMEESGEDEGSAAEGAVVQPGYDYFTKLFRLTDGDCGRPRWPTVARRSSTRSSYAPWT